MNITLPSNLLITDASPEWMNKGDNTWQLVAATLVGLQSVPGMILLYGGGVKKKWAINSAFMALYAFACVLVCWVGWGYRLAFGEILIPFWGKAAASLDQGFLLDQTYGGYMFPNATMMFFQFVFAAITLILIAGALLGRMNFYAWMLFVPLWLTFSYTISAFAIWCPSGFLFKLGLIDFSGGYVIHLSSGVAGFTAAYWYSYKTSPVKIVAMLLACILLSNALEELRRSSYKYDKTSFEEQPIQSVHFIFTSVGPRLTKDRERFPPNNILLMLAGAGLLWMGWTGFNGGGPFVVSVDASLAVLNTHICTATSLLTWVLLDILFFRKASVIGAVQGMITGLVCITPGAGVVQGWAAIVMGICSGSIPWFTMMVVHKKSELLQKVDDTMAVLHTHAIAGSLGGLLTGCFAHPRLCNLFYGTYSRYVGLFYGFNMGQVHTGLRQIGIQIVGVVFVVVVNVISTSLICLLVQLVVPLRMSEEDMEIGDEAAHGEEAYAIWGQGERMENARFPEYNDIERLGEGKRDVQVEMT